jgi:UDP-N-acetylmuramoyl-L-alanyl-D-glutamate--2,6-diaminopimelate ligase
VFFALRGFHTDGHAFIGEALDRGAAAVIYTAKETRIDPGAVFVRVDDCRRALSAVSAAFYDRPSDGMTVCGITGTDGKSSTAYLLKQLIENSGRRCGLLTTPLIDTGSGIQKNPQRQSTPEAPHIHRSLAEMRAGGINWAAVETTSHGLSHRTNRVRDVSFHAGILTNVEHEHLEFHGSFSAYRSDKANLFRVLKGFGVVNADDANAAYFADCCPLPVFSYSIERSDADLYAEDITGGLAGSSFRLCYRNRSTAASIPLAAAYNISNTLAAALTAARLLDIHPFDLTHHFAALRPLPGRMDPVTGGLPFSVIVDYAHTPGAFAKLFPFIQHYTESRLILVFGSAGERDVEKRPAQGRIAAEYADIIFLTDEDPRGEDSMSIIEDIAAGCCGAMQSRLFKIPDRRAAIEKALTAAKAGDTVLLLGKGHEDSIIYRDGPMPWDEKKTAIEVLNALGLQSD